MRKPLTIWFDDKGNMIDYASSYMTRASSQYNYKSELGEDFEDTLVFHRMQNYRSPKVIFKSTKNSRQYCMFLDDLVTF